MKLALPLVALSVVLGGVAFAWKPLHAHAHGEVLPGAAPAGATAFVLVTEIVPAKGQTDALLRSMLKMSHVASSAAGLLGFEVLRPRKAGDPITFLVAWESEQAFIDFHASDEFAKMHTPERMEAMHELATEWRSISSDRVAAWRPAKGGTDAR